MLEDTPGLSPDPSPYAELRDRARAELHARGRARQGGAPQVLKSLVIVAHAVAWYAALLWGAQLHLGLGLALVVPASLGFVFVMFAVMHDGSHRAVSRRPWLNRCAHWTIVIAGGSALGWHREHVATHHPFTNVSGCDPDLETGSLMRLHPGQPRRPWHRWQHWYGWVAYGGVLLKWAWYEDFGDLARRPSWRHGIEIAIAKISHVALFIGLPVSMLGWGRGLTIYLCYFFVSSVVMGTTFVLAHLNGEVEMPSERAGGDHGLMQLATTANFAPDNRPLTWLLGGLNLQIEHHLFPGFSHSHYGWMRPLVKAWAREHGARYVEFASVIEALSAHREHLRALGAPRAADEPSAVGAGEWV